MGESSADAVVVRELLDRVWHEGDVGAAERYIADGYVVHHDPGDPWEGRRLTVAEYVERVESYRAFLPGLRFTIHDLLAGDGSVMLTWSLHGPRPAGRTASSVADSVLAATGATVYYVVDRKVTGHWQVVHRVEAADEQRST